MISVFGKGDEPIPLEKSNQVERILLSPTFERLEKPARLLRRLVDDALAGVEPEEHQLGIDLFERRESWITQDDAVVRQNMTRLRKLLETYYASDGIEDRLNLETAGYKTVFSYNPRHPFERVFRPALRHLATDPRIAFSLLDAALDIEPNHPESLAARAETELWRLMIGDELSVPDIMEAAEFQARQALRYDSKCWRAHVVMGAVHSCRRKWAAAEKEFALAFESSPDKAQSHLWYAAHLMTTGRTEEALGVVRARASAPSETPRPQLTYALFLYVARRFEEAKGAVREAKGRYGDTWLAHVIWSCVHTAQGKQRTTVPLLGMSMIQTLPDGTAVYTALSLLENLWRLNPDDSDYSLVKGMMEGWLKAKEAAMAERDEPPNFAERRVSPFQLAIGYMALGEHHKAIDLLSQDMQRGHPLMTWLHLWPLFDPLRDEPSFKALIVRMNLPQNRNRG